MFAVLYPTISTPPTFSEPLLIHNVTFLNFTNITDFYFECPIQYKRLADDDDAMFDAVLTSNGQVNETSTKTTTSLERTVVFNSTDFRGYFGTAVSKPAYFYPMHLFYVEFCTLANKHFRERGNFAGRSFCMDSVDRNFQQKQGPYNV